MEGKEKELIQLRRKQKELGVTTESLNRLPIFQPSLQAEFQTRVFENKYGKITVKGSISQAHKNVLETILYKRKAYATKPLRILYDEYEVRRYLSRSSLYSYETYKKLIEDMIRTYIKLETDELIVEGTLIARKITAKNYSRKSRSNLPQLRGKEVCYAVIELGDVASLLFEKELRFAYNPEKIMGLRSGISQALVRYLRTHKSHPVQGYHLKELIENLVDNVGAQRWKDIRRSLKKDIEQLGKIGIAIDFKRNRLFVIENLFRRF